MKTYFRDEKSMFFKAKTLDWCTVSTSLRNLKLCCEFFSPQKVVGQRSAWAGKWRAVLVKHKHNKTYIRISARFLIKTLKSH